MIITFYKILNELIGSSILNHSLLSFGIIFFILLLLLSFISILLFLGSFGKYNLFDLFLKLIYDKHEYLINNTLILCIWLTVSFSSVTLLMIIDKSGVKSFYEFFLSPDKTYSVNEYFPRDKFDNFSFKELVKSESSNEILSFSNPESFISDIFLTQKTIYSAINKSTFESAKRRYELCLNLLVSSIDNDIWANKFGDTDQTKFVLIYNEQHTFFTNTTYVYEYFYDNKNPKHSIYGGVNLDSLISQIKIHWVNSNDKELESIAARLGLKIEKLLERADSTGTISLTDEEIEILSSQPVTTESSDPFYLTIKGFEEVEPYGMVSFTIPKRSHHYIEVGGNLYFNDKLYEAIAYRNALLQNIKSWE